MKRTKHGSLWFSHHGAHTMDFSCNWYLINTLARLVCIKTQRKTKIWIHARWETGAACMRVSSPLDLQGWSILTLQHFRSRLGRLICCESGCKIGFHIALVFFFIFLEFWKWFLDARISCGLISKFMRIYNEEIRSNMLGLDLVRKLDFYLILFWP